MAGAAAQHGRGGVGDLGREVQSTSSERDTGLAATVVRTRLRVGHDGGIRRELHRLVEQPSPVDERLQARQDRVRVTVSRSHR